MKARSARLIQSLTNFLRRKRLSADETLSWMCFVNPGMLDPGNVNLFERCIREMPGDAAVVEIGSFCGLSLNHIIYLLGRHGRVNPVFSCDAWEFEGFSAGTRFLEGTRIEAVAYQQHVIDTFRRNVEFFSGDRLPHHIPLGSNDFFAAWQEDEVCVDFFGRCVKLGGQIGLAYIDGDHSYEQSRKDFENIDRYLKVGGFVIFDDSADWTAWGSHRSAREAMARANYELVDRAPNYCIRKTAP
jgi:hypothetical protein